MEINELVLRVKQKDDEAFKEIMKMFHRMMHSIINAYKLEYGDFQVSRDDLYQEACIALYDACMTFDEKRDAQFSTFVYVVIKRRVKRYYKMYISKYTKEVYSIDNIELLDHYKEFENTSVSENPLAYHYQQEFKSSIKRNRTKISEEDRQIVLLRMENYSYEEIAKKLNINTKRIDNRLTRLRKKYLTNNLTKKPIE